MDSIPGKLKADLGLQDEVMKWVSSTTTPSFERARGWVNHATVMRLKYGGGTCTRTRHAIRKDWNNAWRRVVIYINGGWVFMSAEGTREAPKLEDKDLEHLAVKIDERTGFLRADSSRKRKPTK